MAAARRELVEASAPVGPAGVRRRVPLLEPHFAPGKPLDYPSLLRHTRGMGHRGKTIHRDDPIVWFAELMKEGAAHVTELQNWIREMRAAGFEDSRILAALKPQGLSRLDLDAFVQAETLADAILCMQRPTQDHGSSNN